MTFLLALKRKCFFFLVLKVVCPWILHFKRAQFGQLNFLGLSKCLPESDFYLPQSIGQVLMHLVHHALGNVGKGGGGGQQRIEPFFCMLLAVNISVQSTLPKSNSHKSNNRLSRRSFQVLCSLYSIVFNPS